MCVCVCVCVCVCLCVCACVCVYVCVRVQTEVRYRRRDQRPKSHLLLDVSTKQDGLVALSAVDTAIFPLRRNHKDPVDMVRKGQD